VSNYPSKTNQFVAIGETRAQVGRRDQSERPVINGAAGGPATATFSPSRRPAATVGFPRAAAGLSSSSSNLKVDPSRDGQIGLSLSSYAPTSTEPTGMEALAQQQDEVAESRSLVTGLLESSVAEKAGDWCIPPSRPRPRPRPVISIAQVSFFGTSLVERRTKKFVRACLTGALVLFCSNGLFGISLVEQRKKKKRQRLSGWSARMCCFSLHLCGS
jgi:hypothetical protein